jgi:hypothetical protein
MIQSDQPEKERRMSMSGKFEDGLPPQGRINFGWCKLNLLYIPESTQTAGAVSKTLPSVDLFALNEEEA